jgi:hypothetical protein
MSTLDGVYYIRSALNDNKPSLVPGPALPIWPPRPVQVLGLEVTGLRLTKVRRDSSPLSKVLLLKR